MFLEYLAGLLGNTLVEFLAVLVVLVDVLALFERTSHILGYQQIDCLFARLHTPRGIDAGAYFEYDVADGDVFVVETTYLQDTP